MRGSIIAGTVLGVLLVAGQAGPVAAQCSGAYACGVWADLRRCSISGIACQNLGETCGDGGTCQNYPLCVPVAGGGGSCSGSTLAACIYPNCGTCVAENTCNYNGGGSGPSPTPGPSPTGQSCDQANCGTTCSNNSQCNGGTWCQWQGANGFICWDGGMCCSAGGSQSGCGDYCNEATGNYCFGSGFSCLPRGLIPADGCAHNDCCWRDSCSVAPSPTPGGPISASYAGADCITRCDSTAGMVGLGEVGGIPIMPADLEAESASAPQCGGR